MSSATSISIDAQHGSLVIEYGESDGRELIGTRYVIPIDRDPLTRHWMVTAEDFSGERTHNVRMLPREDVPDNIIVDASKWLRRHLEGARATGKHELVKVLTRFQTILHSG